MRGLRWHPIELAITLYRYRQLFPVVPDGRARPRDRSTVQIAKLLNRKYSSVIMAYGNFRALNPDDPLVGLKDYTSVAQMVWLLFGDMPMTRFKELVINWGRQIKLGQRSLEQMNIDFHRTAKKK